MLAILQAAAVLIPASLAVVLAKATLVTVPPLTFVSLQILSGFGFLVLWALVQRRIQWPHGLGWRVWLCILWIGISNFAIARVLLTLSLARLPATTNVYLTNFVGVVTMLLSTMLLRERPSAYQLFGALLAIVGLRIFFRDLPAPSELTGVLYVAIGVLALATTNIVGRKLGTLHDGALSGSSIAMFAVGLGGVPAAMGILAWQWPLSPLSVQSWGVILFNGIASIVLGLSVWLHILRVLRAYEASILASLGVIFTAMFAIPILGEKLQLHEWAGIACMLAGLGLAQLRRSMRPRLPSAH